MTTKKAKAKAKAAGDAAAEKPVAQELIDWVGYIEANNNENLRAQLQAELLEDGHEVEALDGPGSRYRVKVARLEVESGPGLETALRSWCESARLAVLRGEAV